MYVHQLSDIPRIIHLMIYKTFSTFKHHLKTHDLFQTAFNITPQQALQHATILF